MESELKARIRSNLFEAAWPAVERWDKSQWHLGARGVCDTGRPHSSQALAIDVFGTLKSSADRDVAMDAVAAELGLEPGGGWKIELERCVRRDLLNEKRQTQVDAVARSPRNLIFFECKFTEPEGGSCSQTRPLDNGKHKGMKQCNGTYEEQHNPVNGSWSRCALTGKGIRYWNLVPEVFKLEADRDHRPCPFSGSWFQWMRNLVACRAEARVEGLHPAFVVVFADGPGLPMAEFDWGKFSATLRKDVVRFHVLAFQRLTALAQSAVQESGGDARLWKSLAEWVERKIDRVCGQRA